jgi:two-component system response regulator VicR
VVEKAKTILVVDDEPDIRDTLKVLLERQGYRVVIAVDGDDCLHKVEEENPDLILLDIMMPGRPIQEIIEKVKDRKIIFVSVQRVDEAKKQGIYEYDNIMGYVQKPFDVTDLLKEVELMVNA